jgi:hypothetical protein
MDQDRIDDIAARCMTREGAIATLDEATQLLKRPPSALGELRALLQKWDDPVPIDDALGDALLAIDSVLEPGAARARDLLAAMRIASHVRAQATRQTRATRRLR